MEPKHFIGTIDLDFEELFESLTGDEQREFIKKYASQVVDIDELVMCYPISDVDNFVKKHKDNSLVSEKSLSSQQLG